MLKALRKRLTTRGTNGPDEKFKESYRAILTGQYQSLQTMEANAGAKAEADEVVAKEANATWEDLYRLELALIKLEPQIFLRRRAWILRSEYEEVVPENEYREYMESKPPQASGDIDELRADLVRVQEELHWRYLAITTMENYRGRLVLKVCLVGLAVMALLAGMCLFGRSWFCERTGIYLSMLLGVLGAGVAGGLTSALRRIQSSNLTGNVDLNLTQVEQTGLGVYISPALGGVFAGVLLCLFVGKLLDGELFPHVTRASFRCLGGPGMSCANYGKLLVWSFAAGFAEMFVPDNLNRLTGESREGTSRKAKGE